MLRVIADLAEGSQWFPRVTTGADGRDEYTYHCSPSEAPRLARLVFEHVEKPRYTLPGIS